MIRFFFRFIGFWALAGAFIALIYDGTKSIAGSALSVTTLNTTWSAVSPSSLQLAESALRRISDWLWSPLMTSVLAAPTWAVLGILGALLIVIGRKQKPLIGYARD